MLSRSKLNLFSALFASGWSALLQILLVPVYIRLLGVEAYGLVGFYVLLTTIVQIFDFGISPTMSREMARYSVQQGKETEARDFVRTYEIGYWVIGLFLGLSIWIAAPFLATQWINASTLSSDSLQNAIRMMGIAIAFQWPVTFYQGVLYGLQHQFTASAIAIFISFFRAVLTLSVLYFISSDVISFFICQVGVSAFQLLLITCFCWHYIPNATRRPRMDVNVLRRSWKFTLGMSGIGLLVLALTQIDKIQVSRLLPLEVFGYYSVAAVLNSGLTLVAMPLINFVFPRLSASVESGDRSRVRHHFHQGAQIMTALLLPAVAVLVIFPESVLLLWTHDNVVASNAAPIVRILVLGTLLSSFMALPYNLQLAHGWTQPALVIYSALILIVLLISAPLIQAYGAVGAACTWLLSNVIYISIGAPITFRKLLREDFKSWLLRDITLPSALGFSVVFLWYLVDSSPNTGVIGFMVLGLVLLSAEIVAILALPSVRDGIVSTWKRQPLRLRY